MPATDRVTGGLAVAALPAFAAAALYAWTAWCFGSPAAPPDAVAVVGGAVLLLGACSGYFALVGGSGGFFGALLLSLGLLLTVTAADQAASRPAVADCAVREVETKAEHSAGEGSPPTRTVYRLLLDCPDGYPAELKEGRAVAGKGDTVRVAFDPRRRISPEVAGRTTPWTAGLWALALLALSATIAWLKRGPSGRNHD
ncbi:hypothetical protein ACGFXC_05980 [Streptomyces sp. NPDC048507]|uniref:hypothetical protein n=1 Tax=Streptomyces sp. NPDC048507 TaxID=3365560 RepID=UPI00371BDADD